MANYPPGWQYPQPPAYPPGQPGPGPLARPASMRRAVFLIYAGAAVAMANGLVDGLVTHNVMVYTYRSTSSGTTTVHQGSSAAAGIIFGIIAAGLWLWMAWKTGAGRSWARVLSTVFFGLTSLQFLGSIGTLMGSGSKAVDLIVGLAGWGIGLAALILLWQRESSQFFMYAKQAKLAAAYNAANAGYPSYGYGQPGYGQWPQYGQPAPPHGQPAPYGQPQSDQPSAPDQESQRPPQDRPDNGWTGPPR